MVTDDLTDQELGVLIVALKYWRTHRRDTATRRNDPVLTSEAVDLLLAKLEIACTTLPTDRFTTGLYRR
jgi:hypothetical protein